MDWALKHTIQQKYRHISPNMQVIIISLPLELSFETHIFALENNTDNLFQTYNFFFLCIWCCSFLSLGWNWRFRLRPSCWTCIVGTSRYCWGWCFTFLKERKKVLKLLHEKHLQVPNCHERNMFCMSRYIL